MGLWEGGGDGRGIAMCYVCRCIFKEDYPAYICTFLYVSEARSRIYVETCLWERMGDTPRNRFITGHDRPCCFVVVSCAVVGCIFL